MSYIAQLTEQGVCFGPFEERAVAELFAEYLTREVDPAVVRTVMDPTADLLVFYQQAREWDRRQ